MHWADPPAMLRIPCVLDVAVQATGSPPCCRSSDGPQATKKPVGTKKKQGGHQCNHWQCGSRWTDVADVGEDHDPQLNKDNVDGVTLQHDHK